MSLASLIKRLQDIMRKDSGVDGDAQRLAQIVWLIFLKVYDYKEEEAELDDDYVPVIPKGYRWRDWAVGTSVKEQMTGPDLLDFVNNKLIPALGGNPITVDVPIDENGNEITDKAKMKFAKGYKQVQKIPFDKTDDRSLLVKDVMGDATNYMKNGYLLRDDPVDDDFVIYPKGEENATEPKHEIQPTDIVLFDNDACSMVVCGFYSDSFMGYTAKAYCQNKTDDRIDVILDKGSINGFECTPEGAALLEPHSNAYVDIRWQEYAETYAENGNNPTSITEIVMPVFVRKDAGNNTVYIDATYSIDPQARTATPIVNPQ